MRLAKKHKFNAKPQVVDGVRFASKREAARYGELKLLEKAGEIRDLQLQPRYALCVNNGDYPENGHGRLIELGEYRADFTYYDYRTGTDVIEDAKGFRTPLYKWKKKHVEAQYGITIREV